MSDRDTLTEALKRTRLPGVYQDLVAVVMEGWRPPAREITDPDELPPGSVVIRDGVAYQREGDHWSMRGTKTRWDKPHGNGPIILLYVPTEDPDCPHDSRSGAADGRWRCDECGTDCGANTYLTEEGR